MIASNIKKHQQRRAKSVPTVVEFAPKIHRYLWQQKIKTGASIKFQLESLVEEKMGRKAMAN